MSDACGTAWLVRASVCLLGQVARFAVFLDNVVSRARLDDALDFSDLVSPHDRESVDSNAPLERASAPPSEVHRGVLAGEFDAHDPPCSREQGGTVPG